MRRMSPAKITQGRASRTGMATGWAVGARVAAVIRNFLGFRVPFEMCLAGDGSDFRLDSEASEPTTVARPCRTLTGFRLPTMRQNYGPRLSRCQRNQQAKSLRSVRSRTALVRPAEVRLAEV